MAHEKQFVLSHSLDIYVQPSNEARGQNSDLSHHLHHCLPYLVVLTICLLAISHASLLSADLFIKINLKKYFFRNTKVSNSLDPDFVGPDLGPICLQRLSADNN